MELAVSEDVPTAALLKTVGALEMGASETVRYFLAKRAAENDLRAETGKVRAPDRSSTLKGTEPGLATLPVPTAIEAAHNQRLQENPGSSIRQHDYSAKRLFADTLRP